MVLEKTDEGKLLRLIRLVGVEMCKKSAKYWLTTGVLLWYANFKCQEGGDFLKVSHLKWKLGITALILLYATALYVLPISCFFLSFTGIPCLGCGMTRAVLAAVQFRFGEAFSYHYMVWSLPVLYLLFLLDGKLLPNNKANTILCVLLGAGFVVNWIFHI